MPQHDAKGESRRVKRSAREPISKRKPSGDRVQAIGTALKNKVARQRIRTALYRNKLLLKNPLALAMGSVNEGLKAARDYCRSRDMKCLRKDEHGKRDECPFLLQFAGCSLNYFKPGVWSPEYAENLLEARSKWIK